MAKKLLSAFVALTMLTPTLALAEETPEPDYVVLPVEAGDVVAEVRRIASPLVEHRCLAGAQRARSVERRRREIRPRERRAGQDRPIEARAPEPDVREVSAAEAGAFELRVGQVRPRELRARQVGAVRPGPGEGRP